MGLQDIQTCFEPIVLAEDEFESYVAVGRLTAPTPVDPSSRDEFAKNRGSETGRNVALPTSILQVQPGMFTESSTQPVPTLEQLRALAECGETLRSITVDVSQIVDSYVWQHEERLADALGAFADALRAVCGLTEEEVVGWRDTFEVWMAVRDMPKAMDAIANQLNMERLTEPPDQRNFFVAEQDARWSEAIAK